MPATDVTMQEVIDHLPDGAFKTWLGTVPALPPNWTYMDICASFIQGGEIAQTAKNEGVTVAAERLASYSSSITTPAPDPATGLDIYRKTHSVTTVKSLGSFDGEVMKVVAAG